MLEYLAYFAGFLLLSLAVMTLIILVLAHHMGWTVALILIGMLFACNSNAADLDSSKYSLIVHTISRHDHNHRATDNKEWNEANIGLGLRYGNWQVGGYRNSYGKPTTYVLAHSKAYSAFGLDQYGIGVGGFAGLATGYPYAPVIPGAGLYLDTGPVRFHYVPPVHPKVTSVVHMELAFRF